VDLLDGHQVVDIIDISEHKLVLGTTALIEKIESILTSWVDDVARVYVHAERVNSVRIARPFVKHWHTDDGKFDWVAVGSIENLCNMYNKYNLFR
jgi:hypothetical protein